jgi:HPt (histidine-containing phosphotransfer) domain-containing protein
MAEKVQASDRMAARATDGAIDLGHLDRQTLGDPAVRDEVLALFQAEMAALRGELAASSGDARARVAHRVKGAASGIGAHALAECAARLQENPGRDDLADALAETGEAAARFVAKLRKDGAFWRS